jgi:hypothetical protein
MFDHDKIVYLAGIIDGEGSIQIELQGKNQKCRKIDYFSVRLLVINTDKPLIDWICNNFGGRITARKLIENRRQCYKWNISSFKAAEILKECLPFMIVKKRHAEVIIEFMESKPKDIHRVSPEVQEHRKHLYFLLKKINKHQLD